MDVVTLAAARADGAKKISRAAKVSLLQCVATRSNNLYAGLSSASAAGAYVTYRTAHVATCNITSLTLMFGNCYGTSGGSAGQIDGPSILSVRASVEWPVGGNGARAYFRGSRTATIDVGGSAMTDPIPVYIPKGTVFFIRTAVAVPTGGQWPLGLTTNYSTSNGVNNISTGNAASSDSGEGNNLSEATGDLSGTTTTVPVHNAAAYSPYAILGTTSDGLVAVVGAGPGDSIMNGSAGFDDTGWLWRALANGYGYLRLSQNGETANDWVAPFSNREMRARTYQYCTHFVCAHGRNDLSNGRTLAQIQTSLVAQWTGMAVYGGKLYQTTVTPKTTSTDGFTTLANQTVPTDNAVRLTLNAWLRDGAPISAGAAVAVGTSGASRCAVYSSAGAVVTAASGATHPLTGVWELADVCESARDSGKWKVDEVRAVTDLAMTSGTKIVTSAASANFTAADVGRGIYVPGAGSAGGNVVSQITKVVSATQAQINATASTTVSGVTGAVGASSSDGLHPLDRMTNRMTSAVPAGSFTV